MKKLSLFIIISLLSLSIFVGMSLMALSLMVYGDKKYTSNNNYGLTIVSSLADNQENVDKVVKVLKEKNPKIKLVTDNNGSVGKVYSYITSDNKISGTRKTYGYDDEKKGLSVTIFGIKNKLNEEQTSSIASLTVGYDEVGLRSDNIWSAYPNDAHNGVPDKGAGVDYLEFTNIKTKQSLTNKNNLEITAVAVYHLHLVDGKKVRHEFTTSYIPTEESVPISSIEKEKAIHTDYKNIELPFNNSAT